ncbi:hypothetical protein HRbin36_02373 [bacterium HR36]|nr:hypothetical protein HRbin36_02373 [bacterium HR36]
MRRPIVGALHPVAQQIQSESLHHVATILPLVVQAMDVPESEQVIRLAMGGVGEIFTARIPGYLFQPPVLKPHGLQQINIRLLEYFQGFFNQRLIGPVSDTDAPEINGNRADPFVEIGFSLAAIFQYGDRTIPHVIVDPFQCPREDPLRFLPGAALGQHGFAKSR